MKPHRKVPPHRKFEMTIFQSRNTYKTTNTRAHSRTLSRTLAHTLAHTPPLTERRTMNPSNNAKAKGIMASHRAVSETEKELILLGMKVQREIDINWLTIGAEDESHVGNYKNDKFSEGDNGGGWEEQLPLVLQHLHVVQETIMLDLISSDEEVTKPREDTLDLGLSDLDLSSEDESDGGEGEIDYSIEDPNPFRTLLYHASQYASFHSQRRASLLLYLSFRQPHLQPCMGIRQYI